jgi:hypothetical protein
MGLQASFSNLDAPSLPQLPQATRENKSKVTQYKAETEISNISV